MRSIDIDSQFSNGKMRYDVTIRYHDADTQKRRGGASYHNNVTQSSIERITRLVRNAGESWQISLFDDSQYMTAFIWS